MIGLNGSIVARATPYSLAEVEVITATVDLETIRSYRTSFRSRCLRASHSPSYPRVQVCLCMDIFFFFFFFFFLTVIGTHRLG